MVIACKNIVYTIANPSVFTPANSLRCYVFFIQPGSWNDKILVSQQPSWQEIRVYTILCNAQQPITIAEVMPFPHSTNCTKMECFHIPQAVWNWTTARSLHISALPQQYHQCMAHIVDGYSARGQPQHPTMQCEPA